MIDSLWFATSALLPILLLAVLGYFLKFFGLLSEEFYNSLHKFVFKISLPILIFVQIYNIEFSALPDTQYIMFCGLSMFICYGGGLAICAFLIKDRRKAGALAQGMTRSTFSIVGLPLAGGLFGEQGLALASLLLPLVIVFNNVFAVVILGVMAPREKRLNSASIVRKVTLGIITNPLILAMIFSFVLRLLPFRLPSFILNAAEDLGATAQPLALLCLGGGFAKEGLRGRIRLAIVGSMVKTIVLPFLFCAAAFLCGYRGVELGMVCILFGGPTTISSYIMAKNMDSDEVLAGQIVLLSTLMSAFTLFFAFFMMRFLELV